jgi:hypothetical protein
LALTAIPCTDVHAKDTNSDSIEILDQENDHGHSNDVDLCSPFCFCNCCQTNSPEVGYYEFKAELVNSTISFAIQNQQEIAFTNTLWHPPQS